MPIGPGKYDALCSGLQQGLRADAVVLIVFGGERGSGFSVTGTGSALRMIPELLEEIKTDMKKDIDELKL